MIELDEQLREDVRAAAPEMRPEFAAQLERRVESGFAKPGKKRERTLWRPALALAACLLIAGVVSVGAIRQSGDGLESFSGGSSEDQSVRRGLPDNGAGAEADTAMSVPQTKALPEPTPAPTVPGTRRVVERNAELALAPAEDEFAETTSGVLRIADATGTIVQSSNVAERDGRGFARYDLRVPGSRVDEVLADLSRLAKVSSRSAGSQDITAPYVSARERLEEARADRRGALRAVAAATTDAEADAARARLARARRAVARARSEVRGLQGRANRARVTVTVESTGEAGAWTPGDALRDAGRILEVAAGVLLVTLAVVLPLALLLALALAAARLLRRRSREAALGAR